MASGSNPTVPLVLSLVACILFAIGIIIAGYIHGNMHIETVYHSLTNFTQPLNGLAPAFGFVEDDIPYRYSLRKYAPRPQEQEGQSCVGWASSFSALSIMYNVMTNTTDDKLKSYAAFDPYYIYSTIKTFDEDDLDPFEGLEGE